MGKGSVLVSPLVRVWSVGLVRILVTPQNVLGVVPAPANDAGSTAKLPPRGGKRGELRRRGGVPC